MAIGTVNLATGSVGSVTVLGTYNGMNTVIPAIPSPQWAKNRYMQQPNWLYDAEKIGRSAAVTVGVGAAIKAASAAPMSNALADTSNLATPLGRGSTGRTVAANIDEQLTMKQAMSNPAAGQVLTRVKTSDPRWLAEDGWVKMSQNINGTEIHYVRNAVTGAVDDFKFKP